MIGLDAAVLWIVSKLYKKYDMKGFEYFMDEGGLKGLESTCPPVSAAAWPSIYTGKRPDEHGIMDFLHIDRNYDRQLIYYEPEKHSPFWEAWRARGSGAYASRRQCAPEEQCEECGYDNRMAAPA